MTIESFALPVDADAISDLKTRLAATRFPDAETPDDWSQGLPLAYARELRDYWLGTYDWPVRAALLNRFPQFRTRIDGLGIHFIHVRSKVPGARPLLITHGWPGSIVEFHKVIEPLVDPEAHGAGPEQAFHVVCPSLPGYGFSDQPTEPGWNVERIARAWDALMGTLGYERWFAQGGDWGAAVTTMIGAQNLGHCAGIHVNMVVAGADPETFDSLTEQEQSALAGIKHYRDWDSGYSRQQSTRPQTLGYGLADSPMGQAAWIIEKFWSWMDCEGHPEHVVSRDELLDNVMMYWLPNAAASSARLYWESFGNMGSDPVGVPAGCSIFPHEIFRASRRWAEKRYPNIVHWNELDRGGHFAAFERPDTWLREIRSCFDAMRDVLE